MDARVKVGRTTVLIAGALLVLGFHAAPRAQTIEQGLLQLEWGDPAPAVPGKVQREAHFRAYLVKDDDHRVALEPAQARRAAGDLYMLANRRVAVAFGAPTRIMASTPVIEAIVPTDRMAQSAPVAGAPARLAVAAPKLGATRWVTLMCKFSDIAAEQRNKAFFQSQYGEGVGQLGHYWREVSYDKISLAGSTAHGWFTLPHPRAYYVTYENGREKADLRKLFADCGALADAQVDFTYVQGVNLMFNGELDGYAWGGGSCAPLEGQENFCTRVTWNPPWAFVNLAPLAHEMGHGYGLPHSDNSDGDSDSYDNPWDLMSDSWRNAVSDPTFGLRPKHINIFQRHRAGWVGAARQQVVPSNIQSPRQVALDYAHLPGSTNTQMLVLSLSDQPDPYATVVYTLEARKRQGAYEAGLAGDAVIIHRIQAQGAAYSQDADVPAANISNNEGSMFKVGERWTTPEGTHQITVTAQTQTGFLLTVGPLSVMSNPLPPRLQGGVQSASSPPSPRVQTDPAPTVRTVAARPCEGLAGLRMLACMVRER